MKSNTNYYSPGGSNFKNLCLKMKITTLFFFIVLLPISANTLSQKINFGKEYKGSSFSDFIEFVEAKTDYKFFLSNSEINTNQRVNSSLGYKSVRDAINVVMDELSLDYKITDEKLILVVGKINKTFQQQKSVITGVVTDATTNETLPSVTVLVKGTTSGTITDIDGKYSLAVDDPNAVLAFSFIGYKTLEVPVNSSSVVNVSLETDMAGLDEVVVVGYGLQKKGDVTSSVAMVKADDFIQGSTQDAGQLIQGKVAGLTISTTNGNPTGGSEIRLRGTNTISGTSTAPLILIDGIPGDFNSVASEDIESINVLKDGSAAAIYGTQGANGVIIITTKRAKGQEINTVNYTGYITTQTMYRKLDMLSASEFREKIEEGYIGADYDVSEGEASTDWLDEVTRTPVSHVHNLTFRGGTAKTNYSANVNYRDLQGYFLESNNEKSNVRIDVNHEMFDGLLKVNVGGIVRHQKYDCSGDGTAFNNEVYRNALIYNPTAPVKDDEGVWYENTGNLNYSNPLALLKESEGMFDSNWSRMYGSLTLTPVKDLVLKGLFSFSKYNESRGYYETKNHISNVRDGKNGWASVGTSLSKDRLVELTGNYSKEFGNHKMTLLGGYSYKDTYVREFWMQNCDFPSDEFSYNEIELGQGLQEGSELVDIGGSTSTTNLIAFFGRLNYNFNDKYLLMGSVRYEGASQLYNSDNQWGVFPAVSGGWRISSEPFMSNIDFISDLKLRAGFGVTGAQPSSGMLGVATMNYSGFFYSNGEWIQTLEPTRNANEKIKWEERNETNIGLDYGFLNGKINGSIDYYYRRVNGLLMDYTVPMPPNLVSTTTANVGVMDNEGLEILVNVNAVKHSDFEWNTSVTFSTNRNEVKSLSNDLYENTTGYLDVGYTLYEPLYATNTHRIQVGKPIGDFYTYKVVDISDEGEWIYLNSDNERVSADELDSSTDKRVCGNGIPKFHAGWNNTFKYKNFDLSVNMRGSFGFQVLNEGRLFLENTSIQYFNRMKTAYDKVYGKTVLSTDQALEYNSYYLEDGDFWKIDNITVGYNLSVGKLKYIKSARLYASVSNCYTFTGYKGIDPEVSTAGTYPGIDNFLTYPNARTYTFGVNVNF